MWPKIDLSWLRSEVGESSLHFLQYSFFPHVIKRTPKLDEISFRLAPSIVCRSECEVLALSAPRFAVRALLPNGSFVNLRRTLTSAKWANGWEQHESLHLNYELDHSRAITESPSQILVASSERSIADGLIVPTHECWQKYSLVTTDLFAAYGESYPSDSRLAGVPFVQSIPLAGGLCAQAVCFMACCVLESYANGVHGLGEISAIVNGINDCDEDISTTIAIDGLCPLDMCKYFNSINVGLAADLLSVESEDLLCPDRRTRSWLKPEIAAISLDAYVRSGFPVVCLVDAAKLTHFYKKHGLRFVKLEDHALHAMLVVGATRSDNGRELLVNDPSYLPLMRVSITELSEARPDHEACMQFIPVTPKAVKVSLLNCTVPEPKRGLITLFALVCSLFRKRSDPLDDLSKCFGLSKSDFYHPGRFMLMVEKNDACKSKLTDAFGPDICALVFGCISAEQCPCWIQVREASNGTAVLIWRATEAIPMSVSSLRANGILKFLELAFFKAAGRQYWEVSHGNSSERKHTIENGPDAEISRERRCFNELKPAIISSFVCSGLRRSTKLFVEMKNSKSVGLDIYSMMQSERMIPSDQTAEQYLSSLSQNQDELIDLANQIIRLTRIRGIPVTGIATFFPMLSFPCDHKLAIQSRNALIATSVIAETMSREFEIPIVVESVCGSRMQGLYPATRNSSGNSERRKVVVARIVGWKSAIQNVLSNCRILIEELSHKQANNQTFALELEPGPLFTLNSLRSIQELLSCDSLDRRIGINLDIAHFRMANISVQQVERFPELLSRIKHSHISGHHRSAHFGDISLMALNDPSDFVPWLQLLDSIRKSQKDFSGVVSLELEAVKSKDDVESAIGELLDLLRGTY